MPTFIQQSLNLKNSRASKKIGEFTDLCERVQKCILCPRMNNSARILSLSSGSLDAKIMFIGEAPGRLGADATGIPFHGDKAGDNFERLLDSVGISREDIFVTNAVLCNPKDSDGNNAPPNGDELGNCSAFLREQIDLINPRVVVTLGSNALRATALIEEHALSLRDHVRTSSRWYGRQLIPLYHPGQRAMIHRSLINQRSDYQFVAEQLKRWGLKSRKVRGQTSESVARVVRMILRAEGELSYFALHKLLYLIEWLYMKNQTERLTGAYFIRQKDGPYCTDLHLLKLKGAIPDLQIRRNGKTIYLRLAESDLFSEGPQMQNNTAEIATFVRNTLRSFTDKSDATLKTRAYLTKPMKDILREENARHTNMYNAPILIGW
jgi:uracil-DNA glycosylase family 4